MTKGDIQKLLKHWLQGSKKDMSACLTLAADGLFAHALFFLHLSLEKKLKALCVVRTKAQAPYGHNLVYLSGKAGLDLDEQSIGELEVITTFNMSSRYPDERQDFAKKANKRFFLKWLDIAQRHHKDLDKMFKNK